LQFHEFGEVVVVERVSLAEIAARVELIEPDLARGSAFLEEKHYGLHARPLERTAGTVEDSMQIAAFQQELAQTHGGIVGVREKGVLDDHADAPAGFQDFNEMLEKKEGRLAGTNGEIPLHFLAFFTAEGRIARITSKRSLS